MCPVYLQIMYKEQTTFFIYPRRFTYNFQLKTRKVKEKWHKSAKKRESLENILYKSEQVKIFWVEEW